MAEHPLGALPQGLTVLVTQNQVHLAAVGTCVCACGHVLSGEAAMTQQHTASVRTCADASACVQAPAKALAPQGVGEAVVTDSALYSDWAPTGQP